MAGGKSGYSAAASSSGGKKRKRDSPTGKFGIFSTVSCTSSRRVCELFDWCCCCTLNRNCSTARTSARECECGNAGQQCPGCYCWGRRKKWGRLMLSLTTTRGLLGHLPCGADPPEANQRVSPSPVRLPISLSLRAISVAGAGGGGSWGGAGGCRSPRDRGGGGRGEGRR